MLIINEFIYRSAIMREVAVLLSINEHHLFNIYSIGVYLYLLSDPRIVSELRDVSPRDAMRFSRRART